jgi:hypothetical protein
MRRKNSLGIESLAIPLGGLSLSIVQLTFSLHSLGTLHDQSEKHVLSGAVVPLKGGDVESAQGQLMMLSPVAGLGRARTDRNWGGSASPSSHLQHLHNDDAVERNCSAQLRWEAAQVT